VSGSTPLSAGAQDVAFAYKGEVPGPNGISTHLEVSDYAGVPWGEIDFFGGFFRRVNGTIQTEGSGRRILTLSPVHIETSECELWRLGAQVADDYHHVVGTPVGFGSLEFVRQAAVFGTTPYTEYDRVIFPSDILNSWSWESALRDVAYHEVAHVVRHTLDGNTLHWTGDLLSFAYARCHTGREITSPGYAFNEGWADYWERARNAGRAKLNPTTTAYCDLEAGPRGVDLTPDHRWWVEHMIADELLYAAACAGGGDPEAGDRIMVETLAANPGIIHSLYEFETALCARGHCCPGMAVVPPDCPPGFDLVGEFCWGYGISVDRSR
jgi:hypothetical protein